MAGRGLIGALAGALAIVHSGCQEPASSSAHNDGGLRADLITTGPDLAFADGGSATFALGVEYADTGLAAAHAALGVTWTKTRAKVFAWGSVEPTAPAGGHTYDWSCTDATIGEYQRAGMVHVQSYLSSQCEWGDVSKSDVMPRPERLADYRAWVQALVERYDGDGVDDMPGLVAPLRDWVVGAEWTGFWGSGNADDYLALLAATREAAHAANAGARLGLIPFMLVDVFAGNPPTAQQIADRLRDPPPAFRNSTAGMMQLLDHPELFDFVDVHSLGDYTEVGPTLAWLRGELDRRGAARPIWIDDAFSDSMLANATWPLPYPVTAGQRQAVSQRLLDVARLVEPAYSQALPWVRAEVAKALVKKVVTAAGEGASGIQLGNTEDWMPDTDLLGVREAAVGLYGAAAMMGLFDVTHPNGLEACAPRVAGARRPAATNLELVLRQIGAFERVTRVAPSSGTGAWAWRFERGGSAVVVAWNEDGVLQLPGESETAQPFDLPLPGAQSALVTHVATTAGAAPVAETLAVKAGVITLSLDGAPVFVEPR